MESQKIYVGGLPVMEVTSPVLGTWSPSKHLLADGPGKGCTVTVDHQEDILITRYGKEFRYRIGADNEYHLINSGEK